MSTDAFINKVLSPVSMDDFFNSYWEQQPLHVERDDPQHFKDMISAAAIEQVLSTHDLRFPECQLTHSGQHVDSGEYTDANDRIIPLRVVQQHTDGATLVVSRAHRRIAGLAGLVRDTIATLQWRCQANVYLSPPGRQGFNPHYDTHDVFILQAEGAKRFRFYRGGVELPLVSDTFDASTPIEPEMVDEVVLKAGDTLYIPRGLAHDAVAEVNHASLHVTLGAFPVSEVDVVRQCLQIAAEKSVDLRRSVSRAEWLSDAVSAEGERIPEVDTTVVPSSLTVDWMAPFREQALSRLRDAVFLEADGSCGALLTDATAGTTSSPVSDETVLVVRQSFLIAERQGDRLKLRRLGQVLEFDGAMVTAVESLLAQRSLKVSELQGLDEQQRLMLCERLIRERVVQASTG